jgi:hypothetical protein
MRFYFPTSAGAILAGALLLISPAHADGRAEFVTCQARVDQAAKAAQTNTAGTQQDEAALARCRQIIRDWTLRESRMSVDEQGRPLR